MLHSIPEDERGEMGLAALQQEVQEGLAKSELFEAQSAPQGEA